MTNDILEKFKSEFMTTKEDLLEWIDVTKTETWEKMKGNASATAAFYVRYYTILEQFEYRVNNGVFFKKLEDFWFYTICIYDEGYKLGLSHAKKAWIDNERVVVTTDEDFTLFQHTYPSLSIEEYARINEVEAVTVRQWIRRGKIRSAKKIGKEWRIPFLTDVPNRGGYKSALYQWTERLVDLPEQYMFLNDYSCVIINPDRQSKNLFHVTYASQYDGIRNDECDTKVRERLELFLISHPQIHYSGLPEEGVNIVFMKKKERKR